MITEKEYNKIKKEVQIKSTVKHYTDYLSTRFKEVQEEAEKMHWKDKNSYLAGCFGVLLEASIEKLGLVDDYFKEQDENEKEV
tara:strand:+ start:144 stop:392 length:249 start_codon:yes stop_codon:yes gene_type:complete